MTPQTDMRTMPRPDAGESSAADGRSAAAYVAEMSEHLAALARNHGFDALAFILEMAQLEAQNQAGAPAADRRKDHVSETSPSP
jgi:hypothetical protein